MFVRFSRICFQYISKKSDPIFLRFDKWKGRFLVQSAKEKCRKLQLDGRLINQIRNLSEGLIVGTARMITGLREKLQRNPKEPRELWEGSPFFTTRVFHQPRLTV